MFLHECERYCFAMYLAIYHARENTKGQGGSTYSKTTKLLHSFTKYEGA